MAWTPWSEVLARCAAGQETAGDDELLRRFARNRDQAAFELLLWRHGGRVLRLCQGILHDAQEAEDAFQATFLVLARKAGSVRKHVSLGSWLHKVAYRLALRASLARSRLPQDDLLVALTAPSPETGDAEAGETRQVVNDEVLKLPEKYRAAVALCYLAGLSTTQAAEQLGCPRGTVLSRLAAARRILRKRLHRRGVAVPTAVLAALTTRSALQATPPVPTQALVQATCHAARLVAAGTRTVRGLAPHASARAVELMEGTMKVMLLAKLKWALALSALVFLSAGVGAWMQQPAPGQSQEAAALPPVGRKVVTTSPSRQQPPAVRPEPTLSPLPLSETTPAPQVSPVPSLALSNIQPAVQAVEVQVPMLPANTVVIRRPAGDWERVIDAGPVTGTITMHFEGANHLAMTVRVKADPSLLAMLGEQIGGKLPAIGSLEVGIRLSAEYSMASDGLLYGIFTGCELETDALRKLNLPGEEGLFLHAGLAAAEAAGGLLIDQPFSLRFRQDGNALTVKDLKMLGLDLLANFAPGGPAAYQAVVTGRFKRKSDVVPSVSFSRPPSIRQTEYTEDRPAATGSVEQAEKDFRAAEYYQNQGQVAQAFFQYELIRRRYPGTRYATEAATKAGQLIEK